MSQQICDIVWLGLKQCDQMIRLFFNIWPFTTMKISPTMSYIWQSRLSILPKTCKLFAKSGHTGLKPHLLYPIEYFIAACSVLLYVALRRPSCTPSTRFCWPSPSWPSSDPSSPRSSSGTDVIKHFCRLVEKLESVWPDLTKFRHLGKI